MASRRVVLLVLNFSDLALFICNSYLYISTHIYAFEFSKMPHSEKDRNTGSGLFTEIVYRFIHKNQS